MNGQSKVSQIRLPLQLSFQNLHKILLHVDVDRAVVTRIGEGYKLSPSRNYTTFPALTGLAHFSRAKYRYNESLLEITNLTVKIQKQAQPII